MRKADNLPPYRAVVMKSASLNFLEPSGPAQACYGRALPLLSLPQTEDGWECSTQVQNFGRQCFMNAGAVGSIMLCPCGYFCLLYFVDAKFCVTH